MTIWLYGDSISHGFGMGEFNHPSPANSIQGVGNLLLAENDHPEVMIQYAGPQDPNQLWVRVREGSMAAEDMVLFENAGPHFDAIEPYRMWLRLFKFSRGSHRLILTTTPDYNPPPGSYNAQYDIAIGDSGLSINDLVRQEATGGGVSLLDWNAEMDRAMEIMQPYGASPMHRDGIHPNIFGNLVMATALLRHLNVPLNSYETIEQEFLKYRLAYRSRFGFELSEAQVGEILEKLLNDKN